MNKIKRSGIRIKRIKGNEVLNLPPGIILSVVLSPSPKNLHEIVIRTNNDKNPLLGLEDGYLWGDVIDSYTFEIINETITIN